MVAALPRVAPSLAREVDGKVVGEDFLCCQMISSEGVQSADCAAVLSIHRVQDIICCALADEDASRTSRYYCVDFTAGIIEGSSCGISENRNHVISLYRYAR